MVIAIDKPNETKDNNSEITRSKVVPLLNPWMQCNLRIFQNLSEAAINAFCPTGYDSNKEKSPSSFPSEVLHVLNAWKNQLFPCPLVNPCNEELISKGLTDMEISSSQKRKRELEDTLSPLTSNKRILRDKILEGAIEIEPRLRKSSGSGLIKNGEVVNFVFDPGFKEEPSKIISTVEKQFKGKAIGSRRLSRIKQAVRAKFARENARKFDEENGLLEFGRDPFGKRIINIPTFTSSHSLSLTEIDDIQCDEDAKFSLFANDTLQCHSQEK
ncbi:hypothetical protein V6N13_149024 [Hibiscus sabdariffa]|uniref:Uncharacterized protein n=1 Tax=Hibiscus sabdariffa TaxID=183260 RepID=A0ABR2EKX5_9ROSI